MHPDVEKQKHGISAPHEAAHPASREQHEHHSGKRLRQFLLGNGRKVHVASTLEDLEKLQRVLVEEGGDVDLVVHGSPEHVEALRDSHAHHRKLRTDLIEKHAEVWNEVEGVLGQLEALSAEMHIVSEHAVQLDVNFSKYGYDAHIRTHNNSAEHSKPPSTHDDTSDLVEKRDWEAERYNANSMKFFVRPIVRQYFHKGLLWRASEVQEVASYELFADLLYVAIVGITGDSAAEDATAEALLRFIITFAMAWKYWTELTLYMAYFDANDVVRRICVLFVLACLLGFTTNMAGFNDQTYTPLVAFYLAGRLFSTVYVAWYASMLPIIRAVLLINCSQALLSTALWIGSIYVSGGARQALIWLALILDTFGQGIFLLWWRAATAFSWAPRWRSVHLDFIPAINIEHRIERTGGFVTLVFGYSIVSLLYQNSNAMGANAFLGKAVLCLLQSFSFNMLYFEADAFNLHTHAIRRHQISAFTWLAAHLPFTMSFVIAGAALSRLVLAHDCRDADPDTLMEPYAGRSTAEISAGVRWFYCGGLGIALLCTAIIASTHVYKTPRSSKYSKHLRIAFRFAISVLIVLLGFAHSLTSLTLISTTTGLVVLVVMVELLGDMLGDADPNCRLSGWRMVTSRLCDSTRKCKYSARCQVTRKDLEESLIQRKVVKAEELRGEKGGFDFG